MYYNPGVADDIVPIVDIGIGQSYGAPNAYLGHPNGRDRYTQRVALSYVTGSHNFKTGFQTEELNTKTYYHVNGNTLYTFSSGRPIFITQYAYPYVLRAKGKADLGIYAQDQWKLTNQITLNLGIRWDYFNSYVPAQRAGFGEDTDGYWAGAPTVNPWFGQRTFDAVSNVPNWKDWNPRLGVAYDIFGTGKTAVKASLGRYTAKLGTEIAEGAGANPIASSVITAGRAWTDANGNYVPDCDLGNFTLNGECGAIDNANFGKNNPLATRYDPDVLNGYGKRDFNWDLSTEIQHQLREGVGLSAGYYFNNGGYFRYAFGSPFSSMRRATDNLAVTPADYDEFCITAPSDSRLPNGGGYQICGLADIKPGKFGQVQNLVRRSENFGKFVSRNHFINASIDARLPRRIRLSGGFDTGRSLQDNCFAIDSPQQKTMTIAATPQYCHVETPFKAQTQFKVQGIVPIAMGFVTSATWQNLSGPSIDANWAVPTAVIAQTLGRPLAGGLATKTVPLVRPQTLFENRITRLDLRLSKAFSLNNRYKFQLNLDAYNALNANSVRSVNSAFGTRWLTPNQILDPRLIQFGGQVSF